MEAKEPLCGERCTYAELNQWMNYSFQGVNRMYKTFITHWFERGFKLKNDIHTHWSLNCKNIGIFLNEKNKGIIFIHKIYSCLFWNKHSLIIVLKRYDLSSFSDNYLPQITNVILKDNHFFINWKMLNTLEQKAFWAMVEIKKVIWIAWWLVCFVCSHLTFQDACLSVWDILLTCLAKTH